VRVRCTFYYFLCWVTKANTFLFLFLFFFLLTVSDIIFVVGVLLGGLADPGLGQDKQIDFRMLY
jgi:hypothetical protein